MMIDLLEEEKKEVKYFYIKYEFDSTIENVGFYFFYFYFFNYICFFYLITV